jgi:hypothetical protein
MPLKLKTLQYDPDLGRDKMITLTDIDFNPHQCLTREEAARGLHKALSEYAKSAGYGDNSVLLWNEDESNQRGYGKCWMVSWEEGPFEWAINMSFDVTGPWGFVEPYHSFDLCFTG